MRTKRTLLIFILLFVSLLSSASAADNVLFTDWVEDIEYILSNKSIEKTLEWLQKSYSGYTCEFDEENEDIFRCKKNFLVETDMECSIDIFHVNSKPEIAAAVCQAPKKSTEFVFTDMFTELKEMILEMHEDFVSEDGLAVTEEEWETIESRLYKNYEKAADFSYWLFGKNIAAASRSSDKENQYITIHLFPVRNLLVEDENFPV